MEAVEHTERHTATVKDGEHNAQREILVVSLTVCARKVKYIRPPPSPFKICQKKKLECQQSESQTPVASHGRRIRKERNAVKGDTTKIGKGVFCDACVGDGETDRNRIQEGFLGGVLLIFDQADFDEKMNQDPQQDAVHDQEKRHSELQAPASKVVPTAVENAGERYNAEFEVDGIRDAEQGLHFCGPVDLQCRQIK